MASGFGGPAGANLAHIRLVWTRVLAALMLGLSVLWNGATGVAQPADREGWVRTPDIEVFTRSGCPRCEAAARFLDDLKRERPGLLVVTRRVDRDGSARDALLARARAEGISAPGVPFFVVRGTHVIVGFDGAAATGQRLRAALSGAATPSITENGGVCEPEVGPACEIGDAGEVETGWFGRLSVQRLGLPLFTVALGLLDGFNPCAMWVLLFLLSMLAACATGAEWLSLPASSSS
jgi:hypothetical protein